MRTNTEAASKYCPIFRIRSYRTKLLFYLYLGSFFWRRVTILFSVSWSHNHKCQFWLWRNGSGAEKFFSFFLRIVLRSRHFFGRLRTSEVLEPLQLRPNGIGADSTQKGRFQAAPALDITFFWFIFVLKKLTSCMF